MKRNLIIAFAIVLSSSCFVNAQSPLLVDGVTVSGIGNTSLSLSGDPNLLFEATNNNPPNLFGLTAQFAPGKVVGIELELFSITNGANLQFQLQGNLGGLSNTPLLTLNTQHLLGNQSSLSLDNTMVGALAQTFEVYNDFSLVGSATPLGFNTTTNLDGNCAIQSIYVFFEGPNELSYSVVFEQDLTFTFSDGSMLTGDELLITTTSSHSESAFDFNSFLLMANNSLEDLVVQDLQARYNQPTILAITASTANPGEEITLSGDFLDEVTTVEFVDLQFPGTGSRAQHRLDNGNNLLVTVPEASNINTLLLTTYNGKEVSVPFSINPICGAPNTMTDYIDRSNSLPGVELSWSSMGNAVQYEVRYRPVGGNWMTQTTAATQWNIANLVQDQDYEWQVKSVCNNSAPELFSESVFFTTSFTEVFEVQPDVYNGIQAWLSVDTSLHFGLYDYLDSIHIDSSKIVALGRCMTGDPAWTTPGVGTGCFCRQIEIVKGPAIQVEPATGGFNDLPKELDLHDGDRDTKGNYRYEDYRHHFGLGPAIDMKHERYGLRCDRDETGYNLHTGEQAPYFSKISFTYTCITSSGRQTSNCGCVKEVDLDVRYESFHALQARLSARSSKVRVKTDEYAFVYSIEQPSNQTELLFVGHSAYKDEKNISWNSAAWINVVDLAEIVARTALTGSYTPADVAPTADVIRAMIGVPFQIKQASSGGNSGIAMGGKRTLMLRPNTTLTVALHAEGSMASSGTGRGIHRWLAAGELHSNYRMSLVVEPRPTVSEPWCCIKSIARWDSYSLGWRAKSRNELRTSIGTHLTTYHPALDWPQLPETLYLGVHHLLLNSDKYSRCYHTEAVNTCPPKTDPPLGWNWIASALRTEQSGQQALPLEERTEFAWFPNPSFGVFNLALQGIELTENDWVSVYNMQGQLILRQALMGNPQLDLSGHPTGLYLLDMKLSGVSVSTKVVVQ